jgi:hypothetical protein
MKKIYSLHKISTGIAIGDVRTSMTVIADSKSQARHLASKNAGAEGGITWMLGELSTCRCIGTSLVDEPSHVCGARVDGVPIRVKIAPPKPKFQNA